LVLFFLREHKKIDITKNGKYRSAEGENGFSSAQESFV
jgi:hypothetical protein